MTTRFWAPRARLACLLLSGLVTATALGQEGAPTDRLDAAVAVAEASLKRGDLAAAENHYRSVILEGWLLRGWLAAADGRLDAARKAFASASTDGGEQRRALEARALFELQMGQFDEAIAGLARLVKDDPRDTAARRLLAQAHLAAGHPERAVVELEAARAAVPDDLELLFALATSYLSARRYEDAERAFGEIRAARPIPQTRVLIGRAYRDAGEFERARVEFQAALTQDPRVRRAHYYLGMAILLDEGLSRVDEALVEFRKELEVSPGDPATLTFLGAALVLAGRPQEALPSLELATSSPAAPARAFFHLGRCLLALDRPSEAVAAERGALERAQGSPDTSLLQGIHYQLGLALRRTGDREAATPHLAEAQRLSANSADRSRAEFGAAPADVPLAEDSRRAIDPALIPSPVAGLPPEQRTTLQRRIAEALARAYVNLGVIDTQGRQFERAAERFEVAAGLDPEFPQVHYFLGVARYNAGQFAGAAESLDRAGALRPGDADLRRMLAMARFNTGDYAKAIPLLRDDPQLEAKPALQLSYGVALVRSGDGAEAGAVFSRLLDRHGDSAVVNGLLGQALLQQGDRDGATRALERALELDPGTPEANGTLGVIHFENGELDAAERALRAELKAHPEDAQAHYYLAATLDRAGRPAEATPLLRALLTSEPGRFRARQLLGKVLLAQGEATEAAAHLETAARLEPKNADVVLLLAQAYRELGRTEEARQQMEAFRRLKDAPQTPSR